MTDPVPDPTQRRQVSLAAYVAGAAVVWAVFFPLADWVTGDLVSIGRSAVKGAVVGAAWGLAMHPFERWLDARRAKAKRRPPGP